MQLSHSLQVTKEKEPGADAGAKRRGSDAGGSIVRLTADGSATPRAGDAGGGGAAAAAAAGDGAAGPPLPAVATLLDFVAWVVLGGAAAAPDARLAAWAKGRGGFLADELGHVHRASVRMQARRRLTAAAGCLQRQGTLVGCANWECLPCGRAHAGAAPSGGRGGRVQHQESDSWPGGPGAPALRRGACTAALTDRERAAAAAGRDAGGAARAGAGRGGRAGRAAPGGRRRRAPSRGGADLYRSRGRGRAARARRRRRRRGRRRRAQRRAERAGRQAGRRGAAGAARCARGGRRRAASEADGRRAAAATAAAAAAAQGCTRQGAAAAAAAAAAATKGCDWPISATAAASAAAAAVSRMAQRRPGVSCPSGAPAATAAAAAAAAR